MNDKHDFKQNFEIMKDVIDYKSLYSNYKLELLASEIKQRKRIKFGIKNNVISNYLY